MFAGQYVTPYERACADISEERYNNLLPGIFPNLDNIPKAHLPSVALLYGIGGNILFLPTTIQREIIRNAWYLRRHRGTRAAFDRAGIVLGVCIALNIHDDPSDGIRTVNIELCLPSYSASVVWAEYVRSFFFWILPFTLRLGTVSIPIRSNVQMYMQPIMHPYEIRSYFGGVAENS